MTLRSDGQRNGNEGHARASEGLIVVIVVTSSASANKELFEAFECQTRASPRARSSREIDFVRNDAELPWGWGEAGLGHPRRPRDPFGFPQGCLSTYLGLPSPIDRRRSRADRLVGRANKPRLGMSAAKPMRGQ